MGKYKGKTYEERYGIEIANHLKQKRREFMLHNSPMKTEKGRLASSKSHMGKNKGILPKNIILLLNKGIKTRFKKGEISWNKGISPSKETRTKIGLAQMGRKASESTKLKMTLSRIGHEVSQETRKKISLSNMGHKPKPESIEKYKTWRKNQIFPKKDTSIEIKIQKFLEELKIEYFTHKYIKEIEHGYQSDILIPSMNMIIECDGDYWHGNKLIYPNPNSWQKEQINEDRIRTIELIQKGFKVLRLWENEINKMQLNEFKQRLNN